MLSSRGSCDLIDVVSMLTSTLPFFASRSMVIFPVDLVKSPRWVEKIVCRISYEGSEWDG
jgi:hypothetical protein